MYRAKHVSPDRSEPREKEVYLHRLEAAAELLNDPAPPPRIPSVQTRELEDKTGSRFILLF